MVHTMGFTIVCRLVGTRQHSALAAEAGERDQQRPSLPRGRCRQLIVLVLLLIAVLARTANARLLVNSEFNALMDMYTGLSGSAWLTNTGWPTYGTTDPCTTAWFGVSCAQLADGTYHVT